MSFYSLALPLQPSEDTSVCPSPVASALSEGPRVEAWGMEELWVDGFQLRPPFPREEAKLRRLLPQLMI